MPILTVGIDLAKNVFAVHGINESGASELISPAVPRDKLHEFSAACHLVPSALRPAPGLGSNLVPDRPEVRHAIRQER